MTELRQKIERYNLLKKELMGNDSFVEVDDSDPRWAEFNELTKFVQSLKGQVRTIHFRLKGDYASREVYLNGERLRPEKSIRVINHSPDGFAWGYAGSGPAQLALGIMLELVPAEVAYKNYMNLKFDVISGLPQSDFECEVDYTITL